MFKNFWLNMVLQTVNFKNIQTYSTFYKKLNVTAFMFNTSDVEI